MKIIVPLVVAFALAMLGIYSSLPYLKDAMRVREIVEHGKNNDIANTTQEISEFMNDTLTREVYGAVEAVTTEIVITMVLAFVGTITPVIAFILAPFKS